MAVRGIQAAGQWLRRCAEGVAVALLVAMFGAFILQIFSRYVLNRPIGWTEEVSILAWLWVVLWGAAFLISDREEVRFDIVYGAVPDRVRRGFVVAAGLALVFLHAVSLPGAYSFVAFMKVERSAYLHIPINYLYSIYLIFSVACICRHAWLVGRAVRGDGR